MPDTIHGRGPNSSSRNEGGVTEDGRVMTDAITGTYSTERSRTGNLFGLGTGYLTTSGSMSLGGVLYLRNDATVEDLYVQKLVFGWNGGSTNFNRVIQSFIKYNTGIPTANETATTDQIENISRTGSAAVASGKTTAYKWDGVGNGFTSGSGGFLQIPNQIGQGNTSIPIDGEIILGPGNSMEMLVTDNMTGGEAGIYNVAIVYYFAPRTGGRSGISV